MGDLTDFVKHENQPWPPLLAKSGHMREGTKLDLPDSLEGLLESRSESPAVDAKVLDGAVAIHMLTPGTSATFQDYYICFRCGYPILIPYFNQHNV